MICDKTKIIIKTNKRQTLGDVIQDRDRCRSDAGSELNPCHEVTDEPFFHKTWWKDGAWARNGSGASGAEWEEYFHIVITDPVRLQLVLRL